MITKHIFPTKESMLKDKKIKFQQIQMYSNHYSIDEKDKSLFITEWFLKIFEKENPIDKTNQIAIYKHAPDSLKSTISPDARDLIREIIGNNRNSLKEQLGQFVFAGNTGYTSERKFKEENFIFEKNEKYVLALEKKNEGISIDNLVANKKSRYLPLQFFNSRIKDCLFKENYVPYGRNRLFYNLKCPAEIKKEGINIYKGFICTSDIYEAGLKLLIDCSNKIIRTETMWEFFSDQNIKPNDKKRVERFFKNLICIANYGNNRRYRIEGVDFTKTPESAFPDKKYKNFKEYFEKQYKCKIRYPKQFLLLAKLKKYVFQNNKKILEEEIIFLVPELLSPTGLKDEQKNNFGLMKEIGFHTIIHPEKRVKEIESMVKNVFQEKKDRCSFKIDLKSNQIIGYQFNYPKILTGGKQPMILKGEKINIGELENKKALIDWIIIFDAKNENNLNLVQIKLKEASKKFNIRICDPITIKLPDQKEYYEKEAVKIFVEDFFNEEIKSLPKKPQIVFFLVSKQTSAKLYNPVKLFYQKKGIPTQFYVSYRPNENLSKFSNILLQMNCKLGGNLWSVHSEIKNSLLLGFEVSVFETGKDLRSIVALVAQSGANFKDLTNYSKSVVEQDIKKCYSLVLVELFMNSVEDYLQKYEVLPKNIILYRYGMGEGQIINSIQNELMVIKKRLKDQFKDKSPGLIFMVVNKRINDRFFVTHNNRLSNPSGVLICDDVVQKDRANFYLIAQNVNQGTATPTHYLIIDNEGSDLNFNDITEITYNMTFDYKNWNGPIRVPSVLMYASKLSTLITQIGTDKIPKKLKNTLFFL